MLLVPLALVLALAGCGERTPTTVMIRGQITSFQAAYEAPTQVDLDIDGAEHGSIHVTSHGDITLRGRIRAAAQVDLGTTAAVTLGAAVDPDAVVHLRGQRIVVSGRIARGATLDLDASGGVDITGALEPGAVVRWTAGTPVPRCQQPHVRIVGTALIVDAR